MTKTERARMGGIALREKYGNKHFKRIGARGGRATWKKYRLIPYGTYQFALVNRSTGEVRNPNWPFGV